MTSPSINKNLGIQQRIPLSVLGVAFDDYLSGGIDRDRLVEKLRLIYSGENRLAKSRQQICACILRSPLTQWIEGHSAELVPAMQSVSDRAIILSALIFARYSFCYDVAVIFARQFRKQDSVTSELIDNLIGQKYGYNVSTRNSRNCAVPQMIEAGLVRRPKLTLFEMADLLEYRFPVTLEMWKECYFINEPLACRTDAPDLMFEPFFRYLKAPVPTHAEA